MIGYFPDPYPDELFYSLCARFADRMQYPTRQAIMLEMWGSENGIAIVDLPTRLDSVVTALPPHHHYTADSIIDELTLLPFYALFMPAQRLHRLRADMRSDTNGSGIYRRAGLVSSRIARTEWLQFCPACIREDRQHFGEAYWHRIHQAPGVKVCPTHHVWLELSGVRAQNRKNLQEFVSVERAVQPGPPCSLDLSKFHHQVLLDIACEVTWLLSHPGLSVEYAALRQRYFVALYERGLASYQGALHRVALLQAFRDRYPSDLLKSLDDGLDKQTKTHWLVHLLLCQSPRTRHPIHHLLLIHFLGYTLQEFLGLPTEHRPFGEGPWPCLNPTSEHYRQPMIRECHIKVNDDQGGRPMGIFACTCGFVYTRTGPDLSIEDRFRRDGNVRAYGPVWEAKLKELLEDPNVTLKQVADELGIVWRTIQRQAIRLGLPYPYRTTIATRTRPDLPQPRKVHEPSSAEVEFHRSNWLAALDEDPKAGRSELEKKCRRSHIWLQQHDPEWLNSHMPPSRKYKYGPRVDWESRDKQTAEEVKSAAVRLKGSLGSPQVTRAAIGRETGRCTLLVKSLGQLPLTAQALSEVVETREAFAIRRIGWVAKAYLQEMILPTRLQLVSRANVREDLRGSSQVQKAIDAALQMLSQQAPLPGTE